jgi:hypothetical protein
LEAAASSQIRQSNKKTNQQRTLHRTDVELLGEVFGEVQIPFSFSSSE